MKIMARREAEMGVSITGLRSVLRTIGTLLVAVGGYEMVGGNLLYGGAKVLLGLAIYYIKDKME